MKRTWLCFIPLILALAACGSGTPEASENPPSEPAPAQAAATEESSQPESAPSSVPSEIPRPGHIWLEQRGEYAQYVFRGYVQNPQELVFGLDGTLYIADYHAARVMRVFSDGSMAEFGIWQQIPALLDAGPGGLAVDADGNLLVFNCQRMWRVDPQGTILEEISGLPSVPPGTCEIEIGPDGELYYIAGGGQIHRFNPDGSDELVVTLENATNMALTPDGHMFLTQDGSGKIFRVNLDSGELVEFAEVDEWNDGAGRLILDPDGDLWVRGLWLQQFGPDGQPKPFTVDGQVYRNLRFGLPGGLAFNQDGQFWMTTANGDIQRLTPVDPGMADPAFVYDTFYYGFYAWDLDLGPDGAVYATFHKGGIWKVYPGEDPEIIWEYETEGQHRVAVDDDGLVFVATENEIVYLDQGLPVHYANFQAAEALIFAGDGNLYVSGGQIGTPHTIARIDGPDSVTTIATNIDGVPLGDREVYISPYLDQGLYVICDGNGSLFQIDFEGNGQEIMNFGDQIFTNIMAASPTTGKVYLIVDQSPVLTRYVLYELDLDGNLTVISNEVPGDPWGSVVSDDGQWLFISEQGSIDMIPLD